MSLDLAVVKDKLRQLDVLSGLTGTAPQSTLDALCKEITFNDVADLVAEVERLQRELSRYEAEIVRLRECRDKAASLLNLANQAIYGLT